MSMISPREVLKQIASALPEECRGSVIIIGSLAAGYHYFRDDPESVVQTKDVDCMLSPYIEAVHTGKAVAERLFREKWRFHKNPEWDKPGTSDTPLEKLPLVRLDPPEGAEWFLELMASPPDTGGNGKQLFRLETNQGHFALCSFGYLALVQEKPALTEYGVHVARPEMMALANLLHHPFIREERMSGPIEDRSIKRSNKDLGRVLAIAYLATAKDPDALLDWADVWAEALHACFGNKFSALCSRAGDGLRQLLGSAVDMEEAAYTCAYGLLRSHRPTVEQLEIAGKRLVQDALDPLKTMGKK